MKSLVPRVLQFSLVTIPGRLPILVLDEMDLRLLKMSLLRQP